MMRARIQSRVLRASWLILLAVQTVMRPFAASLPRQSPLNTGEPLPDRSPVDRRRACARSLAHAGDHDRVACACFAQRPGNRLVAIEDDSGFSPVGKAAMQLQRTRDATSHRRTLFVTTATSAIAPTTRPMAGQSPRFAVRHRHRTRKSTGRCVTRRAACRQARSASGESAASTNTAKSWPHMTRSMRPGSRSTASRPRAIVGQLDAVGQRRRGRREAVVNVMVADDRRPHADRIVAGREHERLLVDMLFDDLGRNLGRLLAAVTSAPDDSDR